MSGTDELDAAIRNSELARARLAVTARELQSRLSPRRMVDDAIDGATSSAVGLMESAEEAARRRPRAAASIGIVLGLFVVRKPLRRIVSRIFRRSRKRRIDE